MKKAVLVTVTLITRVIVEDNLTDEEIVDKAKKGFQDKIDNDELNENLDSIVDDTECPFGTIEADKEQQYLLTDCNKIHVLGSHGVTLNEKIRDEELFEYIIIDRKDFIEDLIGWISEANSTNKQMMKDDLEMLMNVKDDYIFSSISTNEYITKDDSNFNETCEEIIELNESLK